jgi:CHAT domain-containing protein
VQFGSGSAGARILEADILAVKSSHAIAPALILSLALPTFQCRVRGVSIPRVQAENEPPELYDLRGQANALYRAGKYLQAIRIYETGYEEAKRRRSLRSAVRFLNNLGSAHYQMFRYRDAIQAYLEARDIAAAQGDRETLGALSVNLSSLYVQMGDTEAALEAAEQGLKLPSDATAKFKAKLLIQCARIKERQREPEQAAALLRDAIEASRAQLDAASEAQAWNELGDTLLDCGRLQPAERALLEAFRLRKLTHDDRLYYSYESLGNLYARLGDLQSASTLFDRAIDGARVVSPSAMWSSYYERGNVKLAQARYEDAFADFGTALQCVRRWRAEVLPADAFRISSEVEKHHVYSSFIELGSRLYAQTGRKRFAELTFAAAEESRAASLRALWAGPDLTKKLPNEYWQALADLYREEAALLKRGPDADTEPVRRLRLRVAEMEARAGLDFPRDPSDAEPAGGSLLERTRRALRPTEVFLGFHLGDTDSCLWIVARQGYEFRRLPSRADLAGNAGLFLKALRDNSPDAAALGTRLYSQLFGASSRRLLDKPVWIVAPDGPLFEVPFAALVEGSKPRSDTPVFVVERHAIQVVPGVSALFPTAAPECDGPVVGLADPIYNRADPRLPHRPSTGGSSPGRQPGSRLLAPPIELARLVGSAREIEDCARIWRSNGYNPILLRGAAANRENLAEALRRNPAVLHVAAHILFPPQESGPALVALALQPRGEIEFLSATEIAAMRLRLGLVVLNGCSSARAAALPGAGLMGMTRAWLAAGARAVIVTRWATADQGAGELFQSFYDHLSSPRGLHRRRSFAQLLQEAQLTELRAGGRRANPAYWAAYFCVERN